MGHRTYVITKVGKTKYGWVIAAHWDHERDIWRAAFVTDDSETYSINLITHDELTN